MRKILILTLLLLGLAEQGRAFFGWYGGEATGSTGSTGAPGKGITSVTWISGTHAAGTLDTYKITYTNTSTTTYQVYNGANGTNGSGGSSGSQPFKNISSGLTSTSTGSSIASTDTLFGYLSGLWQKITLGNIITALKSWFVPYSTDSSGRAITAPSIAFQSLSGATGANALFNVPTDSSGPAGGATATFPTNAQDLAFNIWSSPAGQYARGHRSGGFYYATLPSGGSGSSGTVTSVALTAPTGLTVTGSPVTGSGTLALSLTSGYFIPVTGADISSASKVTGIQGYTLAAPTTAGYLYWSGSAWGYQTASATYLAVATLTGSGLTAGRAYYYNTSGALTAADATSSTTLPSPAICVALSATACAKAGTYTTSGLTAGAVYYVPASSGGGALTATAPSTSGNQLQRIGVASSATTLEIMPSLDVATVQ